MRQLGALQELSGNCIDSLSCLHALEHFGLGRYGDPVAADGYTRGLESMFDVLAPGGRLYLATPIGHSRVEFNANYVFSPTKLVSACEQIGFRLDWCEAFDPKTGGISKPTSSADLEAIGREWYRLGLFVFTKPASREIDPGDQQRPLPGMGLA
jgi:SAM-dependent methyltransferase